MITYERLVSRLLLLVPGMKTPASCPLHATPDWSLCSGSTQTVAQIVMHLNDDHHLSREQIADWLDMLDVDLTVHDAQEVPMLAAALRVERMADVDVDVYAHGDNYLAEITYRDRSRETVMLASGGPEGFYVATLMRWVDKHRASDRLTNETRGAVTIVAADGSTINLGVADVSIAPNESAPPATWSEALAPVVNALKPLVYSFTLAAESMKGLADLLANANEHGEEPS